MKVFHEFEPVFDENSEILILGTIPSVKSHELGFYYMHPRNRFWPILEKVYETKIADKRSFLLKNHLALWDVLASCEINSSADSSIKNTQVNDIAALIKKTKISKIYVTGKKALELYNKYVYEKTNIKAIYLPSPSPANASWSLEDLTQAYKILKKK